MLSYIRISIYLFSTIVIFSIFKIRKNTKVSSESASDKLEIVRRRLTEIGDIFAAGDSKDGQNNHHNRHHGVINRHNLTHHLLNKTTIQQKVSELFSIIEDLDSVIDELVASNQRYNVNPLVDTPFDWSWLENRANALFNYDPKYSMDPKSLMLLGLYDELLYRRMPQWFDSHSGFHIKSSAELEVRLTKARDIFNRDCRRDDILLFMCTISKNNAADLQEWIVWQIVVVGVQQIIIYLNGPDEDNSIQVLQPFIDSGYVTTFNATGTQRQNDIYQLCVNQIRKKSCNYGGPEVHKIFLDVPDCDPFQDLDNHNGKDRPVWVAGFDDDELAIDIQGGCVIDQLGKYGGANGLIIPWIVFGHSNHFLTPKNQLNIESYSESMGDYNRIGGMGKGFNRVYFIKSMKNSHIANFINNHGPINEYALEANFNNVGFQYAISEEDFNLHYKDIKPRLYLAHYMTKSIEHLVKKYVRGMADYADSWGRPARRDLFTIMEWAKEFSTNPNWRQDDKHFKEYAPLINYILFGNHTREK